MELTREQKIEELLSRGVAEVIDREHLKTRLMAGEKLRVKLGIDPTSPNIHLGRSIPLLKLRDFQELGCEVYFIIGDFTGQIGDTSDKDSERPMLSEDLVKNNMEKYFEQASRILKNDFKVQYNSSWLSKLDLRRIGELSTWFSLNEFISRENIKKRLDEGKRVSLRELLYPLMQGYDSIMVDADVELGGTDQRFNLLAGRECQKMHLVSEQERLEIEKIIGKRPLYRSGTRLPKKIEGVDGDPQDILMTNLILGTDGRKMSSSWGNTINLTDAPNDMFGKVMSIPDELIESYLVHCTRVPMEEVKEIIALPNPRDAKVRLAQEIVKLYHGENEADKAVQYFIETFSKGHVPEEVREVKGHEGIALLDFLVAAELATSKGEARRKIEQGGVSCEDEKLIDPNFILTAGYQGKILKVGKKDFVKIVF